MTKIRTCLWFDTQAEEAARFYVSLFPDGKITSLSRYGDGAPLPKGTVLVVHFEINGAGVMALNGGPTFKLSPAVSMMVSCRTQDEIDHYWEKLSEGGETSVCGWLTDRFGLSWQVVPDRIDEWISERDPERSARVTAAVMQMTKLDMAAMERAASGG